MKAGQYIIVFVIALAAGYLGAFFAGHRAVSIEKKETVFQHVLRTGTLKCGYASWAPMLIIDGNTKEISGIAHDVIEAAAAKIGVKVDWTEEAGWGEFTQALENNRFDVFCTGLWPTLQRARIVDFTKPFAFSPVNIYGRSNEIKYDNKIENLNQKAARLTFVDGSVASTLSPKNFPLATFDVLPELTPISNIFLEVKEKKADATIMDQATAGVFMKNNPDTIKIIPGGESYRVFPNVFAMKKGEYQLQQLLDEALQELAGDGEIDRILNKYEPVPNSYYRPSPIYTKGR